MLNRELCKQIGLTENEIEPFETNKTPEQFQKFISDNFQYDFEEDGVKSFPSVRTVLKESKAHCWSGAVLGAAYIFLHNIGPSLVLRIEASDMCHHLAVYWENGKLGSIGASRQKELTGRVPQFNSYRELMMSYYPHYHNDITGDKNDLTMRGFSVPVDMMLSGYDWITSESDAELAVDILDNVPYIMLFPKKLELYKDFRTAGNFYFL